jgi:hypothetical protein
MCGKHAPSPIVAIAMRDRSSGRLRARALAFAAASSIVVSLAGAARAEDVRLHVVLVDGTELQGELVEKVPGDHLTIELATGEVRTIPWSSIASTDDASWSPPHAPPPPPLPHPAFVATSSFATPSLGGLGAASTDHDHVAPAIPDPTASFFDGNHLYLGLASGIGTPTGYAGVVTAWDPSAWFELEGGVGLGGKFGRGVGAMARLELPILDSWRFGLGLGYSENFLSDADRAPDGDYPNAPRTAHWLNLEFIEMNFATGKSSFLRFSGGYAFLLNRDDYSAICRSGSSLGSASSDPRCLAPTPFPASPRSYAGDSHLPFVPFFGVEYVVRLL